MMIEERASRFVDRAARGGPESAANAEINPGQGHTVGAPPRPVSTLITEHQVAFSTAAAAPIATPRRRWLHTTLIARLNGMLSELTRPRPARPRHEPSYFQNARMSREMDRL